MAEKKKVATKKVTQKKTVAKPVKKKVAKVKRYLECGECGKDVLEDATECPHCGATFEKDDDDDDTTGEEAESDDVDNGDDGGGGDDGDGEGEEDDATDDDAEDDEPSEKRKAGAKSSGWDNWEKKNKEVKQNRATSSLRRHWMPQDAEEFIIFVDGNDPFVFKEHNYKGGGSWRNWEPCHRDLGKSKCPGCHLAGSTQMSQAYLGAAFTVISLREWKDKQGKVHSNEKKMLIAKEGLATILKKQMRKRKGIMGCKFEISRVGDRAENTGNVLDFDQRYTPEELAKMFPELVDKETGKIEPFDYEKSLQNTHTLDEINSKMASSGYNDNSSDTSSADVGEDEPMDDDIPF